MPVTLGTGAGTAAQDTQVPQPERWRGFTRATGTQPVHTSVSQMEGRHTNLDRGLGMHKRDTDSREDSWKGFPLRTRLSSTCFHGLA